MITINGKVSKMELSADSEQQTVGFSFKSVDEVIHVYVHCMFRNNAPFQLGEEVTLTLSSKRDELPAQIA